MVVPLEWCTSLDKGKLGWSLIIDFSNSVTCVSFSFPAFFSFSVLLFHCTVLSPLIDCHVMTVLVGPLLFHQTLKLVFFRTFLYVLSVFTHCWCTWSRYSRGSLFFAFIWKSDWRPKPDGKFHFAMKCSTCWSRQYKQNCWYTPLQNLLLHGSDWRVLHSLYFNIH